MNANYRVVWSAVRKALMVVNELSSTGHAGSVAAAASVAVMLGAAALPAQAAVDVNQVCQDGKCVLENITENGSSSLILQGPHTASNSSANNASIILSNSSFSNGQNGYAVQFSGSQTIAITNTKFEKNTGAIWFVGHNKATEKDPAINATDFLASDITLTNVDFVNNTKTGSGGAVYAYGKANAHMTGGSFDGNSVTETQENGQAHGGAMVVKSGTWTFENVAFNNNVAKATGDKAIATGGAILVDHTTGIQDNGSNSVGKVIFDISKDMTYSGNRVESESSNPGNTYQWYAYTSGGFLFLDRASEGTFKIAEGSTLTLGLADSTGEDDSIASALPNSNKQDPAYSTLTKTGAGTVQQNSSMDNYYGIFNVEEGTWNMAKTWKSRAHTTVSGGTLNLAKGLMLDNLQSTIASTYYQAGQLTIKSGTVQTTTLTIQNSANATDSSDKASLTLSGGNLIVTDALKVSDGSFEMTGGMLTTGIANVFINGTANGSLSGVTALQSGLTISGGTLNFTDSGEYAYSLLSQMATAIKAADVTYKFENAVLKVESTDITDGKLAVTENFTTDAIDIQDADVEVDVQANLTLTGTATAAADTQKLVGEAASIVVAADKTLTAGSAEQEIFAAELPKVTLADTSRFNVLGIDLNVAELAGSGTTSVGDSTAAGRLTVEKLSGTGVIFVDPAWSDAEELNVVGNASHLAISTLNDDKLQAKLIAGQNALIALNASSAAAEDAFARLAAQNEDLVWGPEGITAALYLGKSLTLDNGGVLIQGGTDKAGTGKATASTPVVSGSVTVASNGLLMINQSGLSGAAIDGSLNLQKDSVLGVINADGSSIELATGTVTDGGTTVVTDNQFVAAELNAASKSIVTTVKSGELAAAAASMGLQAIAQRADSILADNIAERTSSTVTDLGPALWVNVGGESYETDSLGRGVALKSDMGWGIFGADVGITPNDRIGAAVQYGSGTARSSNYGIRNEFDNVGFTLYGVHAFTDNIKVTGELAYLHGSNDVTARGDTKLNNSASVDVLSAGMRGEHRFQVGAFSIVPSLGLRISRVKTDSFNVGAVKVDFDDQTIVQVPLSVSLSADVLDYQGWKIAPFAKVSYAPMFGDKEATVYGVDQDVFSTNLVTGSLGAAVEKGAFAFKAAVTGGTGNNGASVIGGKVGISYAF
ncbi:autotransporter domain-containing protein [Sutterella wadsworthensis]|uniref:autotransporter domain-containing protein n=1 Tax=Sutterella wadsworthensis TaxID=40545 RepID=UPI0013F60803|nr:autotransporter domain-containing protein [Sutterella wadsworthensis]